MALLATLKKIYKYDINNKVTNISEYVKYGDNHERHINEKVFSYDSELNLAAEAEKKFKYDNYSSHSYDKINVDIDIQTYENGKPIVHIINDTLMYDTKYDNTGNVTYRYQSDMNQICKYQYTVSPTGAAVLDSRQTYEKLEDGSEKMLTNTLYTYHYPRGAIGTKAKLPHIKIVETFDSNGDLVAYEYTVYDGKNNKEIYHNSNGYITNYCYDEDGLFRQRVTQYIKESDPRIVIPENEECDTTKSEEINIYDQYGNKSRVLYRSIDLKTNELLRNIEDVYEYSDPKHGKLSKFSTYVNGELVGITEYDDNGRISSIGNRGSKVIYTYADGKLSITHTGISPDQIASEGFSDIINHPDIDRIIIQCDYDLDDHILSENIIAVFNVGYPKFISSKEWSYTNSKNVEKVVKHTYTLDGEYTTDILENNEYDSSDNLICRERYYYDYSKNIPRRVNKILDAYNEEIQLESNSGDNQ